MKTLMRLFVRLEPGSRNMKLYFFVFAVTLIPLTALAQPIGWLDYVVPETGAVAQIPTTVFSDAALLRTS
jgi:hypothetical protein